MKYLINNYDFRKVLNKSNLYKIYEIKNNINDDVKIMIASNYK
jgi:hypothetical protein